MFWQCKNGTLVNLNAFEKISVVHDTDTGLYHVRGQILNQPLSYIDLFSEKDKEHVEGVLKDISSQLQHQGSLVGGAYVR